MELKEALVEIYKAAQEKFNIKETPKLILRKDEENAKGIFGEFQGPLGLPKMFLAYYNSIVNKVSTLQWSNVRQLINIRQVDNKRSEQCKKNLQFQAIVNIQLASQLVNNITRDRRVTETDQLSSLGNSS